MLPLLLPLSDAPIERGHQDLNLKTKFVGSRSWRKALEKFRIGFGLKPSNPKFQSTKIKNNAARSVATVRKYPSCKLD